MSQYTIEIGENRHIAISEIGETDGKPIVVNHGMIASIRDDYFFDGLVKNGFRVISCARPGYGLSTAFEMKNVKEWGMIVEEVMKQRGITEFDVLGISSGAPYSYAIASVIPYKVRNVYIFSGTPALNVREVAELWPYPLNTEATIAELQGIAKGLFFADGVDQNDNGAVDAAKNECFGIALDLKLRCHDWGFVLGEIKNRVYMEHGISDNSVPYETAEITAGMLGNCILHKRKPGGHFSRGMLDDFIRDMIRLERGGGARGLEKDI